MRGKSMYLKCLLALMLAAALALGGCGSDGKDGRAGQDGQDGTTTIIEVPATEQPALAQAESCFLCHADGRISDPATKHVLDEPRAAQWNVVGLPEAVFDDTDLDNVIRTVTIEAAIEDRGYTLETTENVRALWNNNGTLTSTNNAGTAVSTKNEDGSYTIVITVGATLATAGWNADSDVTWRVRLKPSPASDGTYPEAGIVAYQNDGADVMAAATTVSNESCINCHGNNIFIDATGTYMSNAVDADGIQKAMSYPGHFGVYGVESCVMCHGNASGSHGGDRLMIYAHGVHNSGGLDGNYGSSAEVKGDWNFSVRYPSEMNNCIGCHDSEANLDTILDASVSYNNCVSCHGGIIRNVSWTGTTPEQVAIRDRQRAQAFRGLSSADKIFGGINHSNFTPDTNCAACHDNAGSIAKGTVADYHSGFSDRGLAQYIAEENFIVNINSVERVGLTDEFKMTWTATNTAEPAVPYNVCGTTAVAGLGDVTFSPIIRLAYFEPNGDDITNVGVGNIGQPAGTKTPTNVCADGQVVSTFTIDTVDMSIERALAILKPQATVTADPALVLQGNGRVRIPAVSYAFDLDDGAKVVRRMIVDSQKCLDCHGALLYNHGATGGRFDNVDSCIACHNSGATDQGIRASLRFDGEPISAANSFDGKDAETFSFAYNMHAIHSAGVTDSYYVVYRGRGIYGYGGSETKPKNWPLDADGNARPYLSNSAEYNLVTNAAGTAKVPAYLKKVNYPRPLMDCTACHADGWKQNAADQAKAVAVSITSGADLADQNDDKLMGPATATCVSCHSTGATRGHAFQNSWTPAVIDGGKGAVLDAAK